VTALRHKTLNLEGFSIGHLVYTVAFCLQFPGSYLSSDSLVSPNALLPTPYPYPTSPTTTLEDNR
jgi:hypothetical protein